MASPDHMIYLTPQTGKSLQASPQAQLARRQWGFILESGISEEL
jgi:hypothetical protein